MKQILLGAAVSLLAATGVSSRALAAGWHYYDPECPVAIGEKSMKFVAMQPKKNIDRECVALPDIGPSVIVLDASDNELRDMNWDIRVLRAKGPDAQPDPDADAVSRLPVQKFRNGMVNFDQKFKDPGYYVLYAKLTSDDGAKSYEGRHPFSVGMMTDEEFYLYLGFGLFAVVAGGAAFTLWRQGKLGFKIPNFGKPT
ncbi:hypothetical protein [Methylocystis parvus]|uniref:Uncharacterized protein n=1 Tax=Methylocystis parvus TaxID=134 RepID=A0A6B8M862_9HYPH|nr:hypothetical protein [Methylocystis parvus]QGM98072.1 hypothetical protein F7D14_11680 [Methylocystis parvus]WBK01610.1 hypothetical protein MMG94_07895 [Methylocystis parvus OBBP]